MKPSVKILFLCPYPYNEVASQRFRFEQYYPMLEEKGMRISHKSFYTNWAYACLYDKNRYLLKSLGTLNGFIKRAIHTFYSISADFVFIHRELTPIGPPIFEWIISKIMGKKIIYDFDDAIWIPQTTRENQLISTLKWHRKFSSICRWSYKICCCNDYLAAKARVYNSNIVKMPTTLDTDKFVRTSHGRRSNKITIGWTGTHSTLPYLTPVLNIIQKILEQNTNIDFKVICNKRPNWRLPKVRYVEWAKETELVNLSDIDIGIMPLPESEWAKGKCGFKILQYFSMGIPAIASPVGINSRIIIHGENGYLCRNDNDWKHYISLLVESRSLRDQLGRNGRKTVESFYSVASNVTNFLDLFR